MPLKLRNNIFINCGTGVSTPDSAEIEAEGNKAFNTDKMFDIRDGKKPKEKWYQKWWGQILIGLIVLILGTVILKLIGII